MAGYYNHTMSNLVQSRENKCWRCLGFIKNEKVRFQEKQYHPGCYCCDICKKSLKALIVHEENGKLYDKTCYTQLQDSKCARCKTLISKDGECYKNKWYHPECFKCKDCGMNLVGRSFHFEDGFFYDADCFANLNAFTCDGCTKQIDGNDINFSMYKGKYYHHRCFTCCQCKESLSMKKFRVLLGQRYCSTCR